jgi:YidC/Oxa1 family membrane protein insertase
VIDFFVNIGHAIMTPLYYVTSWLLVFWHSVYEAIGISDGWSWAMGIISLTIVIRICLIPLFVKQIKNSRNLQLIQPKVKELQKKYSHDRERLTQETMKLYKETGTNPLASCLPLILQMPIFLALFHTLNGAADGNGVGVLTDAQARDLSSAPLFGDVTLADSFTNSSAPGTKLFAALLVVLMTITTFTTQRQLMRKNMPESALTGQYAQQQKILLYVLPVVFAVGGIAFPIGVLMYWSTSNLWTMGQQFYVIRNNPTPGTPAFFAKQERDNKRHPERAATSVQSAPTEQPAPPPPPRAQPKKQSRDQRKRKGQGNKTNPPGKGNQQGKKPGPRPGSEPEGDAAN